MCIVIAACSSAQDSAVISEVELISNPSGRVPLVAAIQFRSDAAVNSAISITDGTNSWVAEFDASVAADGLYTIPIVGMRADRAHQITLTTQLANGSEHRQAFDYRTPPLPENPLEIPPVDVSISETSEMEPGVLFLSVRRRALGRGHWLTQKQRDFSEHWGILVALDKQGEIIWYYESDFRTAGISRLQNGNLLLHRTQSSTLEIDLLGNTVRQVYAEDRPYPPPNDPNAIAIKGQQTLHHQPHQMPNGNYLAFSANGYPIENWYSSAREPEAPRADTMIMADTVVELTPDGDVVWSWNTMDYLDTERIGYDTFWSYWWVRGFDQHHHDQALHGFARLCTALHGFAGVLCCRYVRCITGGKSKLADQPFYERGLDHDCLRPDQVQQKHGPKQFGAVNFNSTGRV